MQGEGNMMRGREYAFAKAVSDEQAAAILEEGKALEGMEEISISDDLTSLTVKCAEELYPRLMTKLVNIVARLTGGNSFSFTKFLYEE